jgi:predicted TIM-barrel fold metal-dependent hydrolase
MTEIQAGSTPEPEAGSVMPIRPDLRCFEKEKAMTKRIDFEAHFMTQGFVKALYDNKANGYPHIADDGPGGVRCMHFTAGAFEPFKDPLYSNLMSMDEQRVAMMDKAGVDVQVLSLTAPGPEQFKPSDATALARDANDELAAYISKYPDRFKGFAALSPKEPESAAKELERSVKELGLVGWKTHSNFGDSYLDDQRYWPVLEAAADLGVPVYLHPTAPMISQLRQYGFALAGAPFGFGVETAMCTMRLIFSGAMDRFPGLRIILGHLGETLPFILERIDFPYVRPHFDPEARPDIAHKPSEYIKERVFVTTSGMPFLPALRCTIDALGPDRILLGTDYPYESMDEAMSFLNNASISEEEREQIYSKNAEQLGL